MSFLKQALLGVKQESSTNAKENVQSILQESGIRQLYLEVGEVAQQLAYKGVQPSTLDSRHACSAEAAELLAEILDGRFADLLSELLGLFRCSQKAVPAFLLPPLLDKGSKVYTLRPEIIESITEVGHWLASQNPDWGFAEAPVLSLDRLQKDWQSTNSSLKQGIFYQARLQNPALALSLMQTTWKSETPASVTWIIRLMAYGLSMQDETFLELALDDRNLTVRRKASELLACLPDSRLATRMTEVAREHLSFDGSDIHFEQPELKPELLRDGFLFRTWKDEEKLKQAYLSDLVAAVPLDYWTEAWQLPMADLLSIVLESSCREGMIKGLATAAERQTNQGWMKALLLKDPLSITTLKLVNLLDEQSFLEIAKEFAKHPQDNDYAFAKAYSRWTEAWSEDVYDLWQDQWESVVSNLLTETKHMFMLRSLFKQAAKLSPISRFKQLAQTFSQYSKQTDLIGAIQESQSLLKFRNRMFQSFDFVTPIQLEKGKE